MKTLELDFEHCFGINKLAHRFNFEVSNTQLLYASNGVMKTSFADSFSELSKGNKPVDRLFGKPTKCEVTVDGISIDKEFIHVVKSFESIDTSKSQTRLLVDQARKAEYDGLIVKSLEDKRKLIVELNRKSGIKKESIEQTIMNDFKEKDLFKVLKDYITTSPDGLGYEIRYDDIINPDVIDFLGKPKVKANIDKYFDKYSALLEKSKAFKKGVFNPNQADNVSKSLQKENYFAAKHKIKLNGVDEEFEDINALNEFFIKERKEILDDEELLDIEKEIKKVAVKNLQQILERYPIVSDLKDIDTFKKKLWYRYFFEEQLKITFLISEYDQSKNRLAEIEEEAKNQSPEWQSVIDKFKQRFSVPFDVRIENKAESILGREVPNISFVFTDADTGDVCTKKQNELEGSVLSQGERRAMYLMNVLFEIEARKTDTAKTLFIFDDVADSFDYKNKYAIVEYLRELTFEKDFYQIILTHNYDFYRTIQKRVIDSRVRRDVCFVAQRELESVSMIKTGHNYQDDPFSTWKKDLSIKSYLISTIPFVRNIIEFKEENNSVDYKTLTALLHVKGKSRDHKISDLKVIFDKHIKSSKLEQLDQNGVVYDLIIEEAERLSKMSIPNGLNLEHKIVLSIGIRLKSEEYMWHNISDKSPINGDQSGKLLQRFKDEFSVLKKDQIKTLEKVNLITAENIHLNSFMFEPLIDLSINHLQELYKEVETNCI